MTSFTKGLFLCLAILASPTVRATAQVPDVLVVEGEKLSLNTNPLDAELERMQWQLPEEAVTTTANWRGYVATWEIRDAKLFLKAVSIRVIDEEQSGAMVARNVMGELYPDKPEVFADWYSGALIVPDGERTGYVHMGYGSSFDHYQIFRVTAGEVVEHLSLTGTEFAAYKDRKFDEFMETEQFKKAYAEAREGADGLDEEAALHFIRAFYAEQYLSH